MLTCSDLSVGMENQILTQVDEQLTFIFMAHLHGLKKNIVIVSQISLWHSMRYCSQSHSMYRANVPNQIYILAIIKNIWKVSILFLIWWTNQQLKKKTTKQLYKIEIKYENTHSFTMTLLHYTSQVLHE